MSVEFIAGWDFESCLLIFKKLVNKDGILSELKAKEFFLTRTQRRKIKDLAANRRRKKKRRGGDEEEKVWSKVKELLHRQRESVHNQRPERYSYLTPAGVTRQGWPSHSQRSTNGDEFQKGDG
jgi:ribosomal protein S21